MNIYEIFAYLLPVIMLALVTPASLLPYLVGKRRGKKRQSNSCVEKEEKIRDLSRERVASSPTNDSRDDMNVGKTQEDERI